jgi:molybdate transport system substrate-binding protein
MPNFQTTWTRNKYILIGVVLAGLVLTCPGARAGSRKLLVFAAASQQDALNAVIRAWHAPDGVRVNAVYAASSTLARQIAEGAPADIFISADIRWMDYLARRGLLKPSTRVNLLGNQLVLIAPANSRVHVMIKKGLDLAGLLHGGRLAMGDPDHVPAGIYGREALQHLGAWSSIAADVARADNVRAALALVSRCEAPLGIVYLTDALSDPHVRIVGRFPADSHPPIIYPAAVIAASRAGDATAFLQFLETSRAAAVFSRYGFKVLEH